MFYKILLLSQSGKGKTYSTRNLDPDTTGFINCEEKPLPFRNKFKYYIEPRSHTEAYDALIRFSQIAEIEAIVIDSFSSYFEMLLSEARATKRNFDVWNLYNDEIQKFMRLVKRCPKHVFLTGHYEMIDIEGAQEKRAKVKGKEWEGLVEKEFTIVMYGDRRLDENKKVQAWFDINLDGSSAKCFPDLFGEDVHRIPNDCKYILDKINEFNRS